MTVKSSNDSEISSNVDLNDDDDLPLDIKIIKAFIDNNEYRLSATEIANYCNSSIQAITYHLKKFSKLIILELNNTTNKKYYYLNEFFLESDQIDSLKDALLPFVTSFLSKFEYDEDVTDLEIELSIIDFLRIIAWLSKTDPTEELY